MEFLEHTDELTEICDANGERYEVLSLLGQGGMGTVYKARELRLNREVALKVMSCQTFDNNDMQRFVMEAKATARVEHINIIKIFKVGATSRQQPFLVLEYFHSITLSQKLLQDGVLNLPTFVEIFDQIMAALQVAHEAGIVHRDLKSSNILLNANNQVKIADFGIARVLNSIPDRSQKLTRTGDLLGTPGYMSPEQCRSEAADARSDIYALGCVMYEALTGEPLFHGDSSIEVMYKQIFEMPPQLNPEKCPAAIRLQPILDKALQKQAANRFQSIAAMRALLKERASGHLPINQPEQTINPGSRPPQGGAGKSFAWRLIDPGTRWGKLFCTSLFVVTLMVAGTLLWTPFGHPELTTPTPPDVDEVNRLLSQAVKDHGQTRIQELRQVERILRQQAKQEEGSPDDRQKLVMVLSQLAYVYHELDNKALERDYRIAHAEMARTAFHPGNITRLKALQDTAAFFRYIHDQKTSLRYLAEAKKECQKALRIAPSSSDFALTEMLISILNQEALVRIVNDPIAAKRLAIEAIGISNEAGNLPEFGPRLVVENTGAYSLLFSGNLQSVQSALTEFKRLENIQNHQEKTDPRSLYYDLQLEVLRGELKCLQLLHQDKEETAIFYRCLLCYRRLGSQPLAGKLQAQQAIYLFNTYREKEALDMMSDAVNGTTFVDNKAKGELTKARETLNEDRGTALRHLNEDYRLLSSRREGDWLIDLSEKPEMWWSAK